jgi:hypothetical protein
MNFSNHSHSIIPRISGRRAPQDKAAGGKYAVDLLYLLVNLTRVRRKPVQVVHNDCTRKRPRCQALQHAAVSPETISIFPVALQT